MKKIMLFCFLFFFGTDLLFAQDGFVKIIEYPSSPYLLIQNIIQHDDTIVISGSARDSSNNFMHGVYLAKLDTFGNILQDNLITVDNDFIIHEAQYGLIKDSTGYAISGQYFFNNNGVLIRVDNNLNLISIYEFREDANLILNTRNEEVLFFDNYYYLTTRKFHSFDNRNHTHIVKVDTAGRIIFDKWFNKNKYTASFIIKLHRDSSRFDVYGSEAYYYPPDTFAYMFKSKMTFDGNIGDKVFKIFENGDGINSKAFYSDSVITIVGGNNTAFYTEPFVYFERRPIIRRINDDLTNNWVIKYKELVAGEDVGIVDINLTPDGNFISPIQYPDHDLLKSTLPNRLLKYTKDGKILWERIDTILFHPEYGSYSKANGSVVLSSGSIIVAGTGIKYFDAGSKFVGYLLKVDKSGCLDGKCPSFLSSTVPIDQHYKPLEVYPNPTSGILNVNTPLPIQNLYLIDVQGRTFTLNTQYKEDNQLDLSQLPSGNYMLFVQANNQYYSALIVKN